MVKSLVVYTIGLWPKGIDPYGNQTSDLVFRVFLWFYAMLGLIFVDSSVFFIYFYFINIMDCNFWTK